MPRDETSEVFLNDDGRFLLLDEVLHGKVATDQRLEDNDAAPQVVVLGSGFEAPPRPEVTKVVARVRSKSW